MQKTKLISIFMISLFFFSVFAMVAHASPTIVYVDDDYNPTTPGWGTDHFANIQSGINAVAIGGTVIVYDGTYHSVVINKMIILEGQGWDVVIIDGGGSGSVVTLASDHINISGVTIRNGDNGIDLLSNYNIVHMCIVKDNSLGFFFNASNNNTIFYNDVVDNSIGMDLFTFDDFDNLIYNNNFLNCDAIDDYPGFVPTRNRWNETYGIYPSGIIGGNFWYDAGSFTDLKHGTYPQSLSGSDGIIDYVYNVGRSGYDYYPHLTWIYPPGLNTPPVISDEDPSDGSADVSIHSTQVSVLITDDGTFNWTIEGGHITSVSGTDETTGTKTANIPSTLPYFTTIRWYVNATDGTYTVRSVFTFRTETALGMTIQDVINSASPGDTVNIPIGIYTENVIINKSVILMGADKYNTIIDGSGGDVLTITANDVTIEGFTLENGGDNGITLNSDGCYISGNIIINNINGIHGGTSGNTITHNYISGNTNHGIRLNSPGGYNTISYNTIDDNDDGIFISQSGDVVVGNTVTNNHINGMVAIGYISPWDNNLTISENIIHSNWNAGISIFGYKNSIISNNNVSGNEVVGIVIVDTEYNVKVIENDIYGYNWQYHVSEYQPLGLLVKNSSNLPTGSNTYIYHNNFFDNLVNAQDTVGAIWSDYYPSGGNYWSDRHNDSQGAYDRFRGKFQSISGVDGIVDTPYSISGGASSQDIYPLRNPYRTFSLASADFTWMPETPKKNQQVNFTSLSTGGTMVAWFWDFGDGNKGSGETVSHNYSTIGYFSVKLTALNNRGLEDTAVKTIFVAPRGPFIPPIQKAKYPGYTVGEMYELLKADKLPTSNANIKVFVIDSGVFPGTYDGIDLSKITELYATGLTSGVDGIGHGSWTNYAIRYILQKLPNAHQYSYRIFDANGDSTDAEFMQALDTAMRMNVDIVSISAGAIGNPSDQFSRKVAELKSQGIFVFCAGGNFGPYSSTIISPGCSKYAIAISAEDPQYTNDPLQREIEIKNLADDTICNWSSRGPVPNVYPKPDVTAPGESIKGPWVSNGFLIEKTVSGTSMSTPLISGATAIVIAENKGLIDMVKTVHFWDKSIVVTAYEEALRDTCYKKGNVNDWGAGIAQFDKISSKFQNKLVFALIISILELLIIPIVIIISIIYLYYVRGKRGRKRASHWKGW